MTAHNAEGVRVVTGRDGRVTTVPVVPLVIHLSDPDWRNGVACNQPRRGRPLQTTSDAWAVTCRHCLTQLQLRRGECLDGQEDASCDSQS